MGRGSRCHRVVVRRGRYNVSNQRMVFPLRGVQLHQKLVQLRIVALQSHNAGLELGERRHDGSNYGKQFDLQHVRVMDDATNEVTDLLPRFPRRQVVYSDVNDARHGRRDAVDPRRGRRRRRQQHVVIIIEIRGL